MSLQHVIMIYTLLSCEAYTLLRQMDMGYLTRAHIWVRAVHTKGGQAQTNLYKSWLRGTETNAPPGDQTQWLRIGIPTL